MNVVRRTIEERPSPAPGWVDGRVPESDDRVIYFKGPGTESLKKEEGIAGAFAETLRQIALFLRAEVTYEYQEYTWERIEKAVLDSIRGEAVSVDSVDFINQVIQKLKVEGAYVIRKAQVVEIYIKPVEVDTLKGNRLIGRGFYYDVWVLVSYPQEEVRKLEILSILLPPDEKLTPEVAEREERKLKTLEIKGRYNETTSKMLRSLLKLSYEDVRYTEDYAEGRSPNYVYFTTASPLDDFLKLDAVFSLTKREGNFVSLRMKQAVDPFWERLTEALERAESAFRLKEYYTSLEEYSRTYYEARSKSTFITERLHGKIEELIRTINPTDAEESFRIVNVFLDANLWGEAWSILKFIREHFAVSSEDIGKVLDESFNELRERTEMQHSNTVSLIKSLNETALVADLYEAPLFGDMTSYLRHIDPGEYERWTKEIGLSGYWDADSLYTQGALREAEKEALKALEKGLKLSHIYLLLGKVYYFLGQYDQAKAYLAEVTGGNLTEAYAVLGNLLLDRGQMDEAEKSLQKAMQASSGNEKAYLGLARFYLAQGDSVEAEQAIYKARAYGFEKGAWCPTERSWFDFHGAEILEALSYRHNAIALSEQIVQSGVVPPILPSIPEIRGRLYRLKELSTSVIAIQTPEDGSSHQGETVYVSFQIQADHGVNEVAIANRTTGYRTVKTFDGNYNISSDWPVPINKGWNAIVLTVNGESKRIALVKRTD